MADFYYKEYGAYKENSVNGIIQNLKDHIKDDISGFQQYKNLNFDEYEDYRFIQNGGKNDQWTIIEGSMNTSELNNSKSLTSPKDTINSPNFLKNNYKYYINNYPNLIEQKKTVGEGSDFHCVMWNRELLFIEKIEVLQQV